MRQGIQFMRIHLWLVGQIPFRVRPTETNLSKRAKIKFMGYVVLLIVILILIIIVKVS